MLLYLIPMLIVICYVGIIKTSGIIKIIHFLSNYRRNNQTVGLVHALDNSRLTCFVNMATNSWNIIDDGKQTIARHEDRNLLIYLQVRTNCLLINSILTYAHRH